MELHSCRAYRVGDTGLRSLIVLNLEIVLSIELNLLFPKKNCSEKFLVVKISLVKKNIGNGLHGTVRDYTGLYRT